MLSFHSASLSEPREVCFENKTQHSLWEVRNLGGLEVFIANHFGSCVW